MCVCSCMAIYCDLCEPIYLGSGAREGPLEES